MFIRLVHAAAKLKQDGRTVWDYAKDFGDPYELANFVDQISPRAVQPNGILVTILASFSPLLLHRQVNFLDHGHIFIHLFGSASLDLSMLPYTFSFR